MGKQYNKVLKRKKRKDYLRRKKSNAQLSVAVKKSASKAESKEDKPAAKR